MWGYGMYPWRPAIDDVRKGQVAREGQGYSCLRHDMMMMMTALSYSLKYWFIYIIHFSTDSYLNIYIVDFLNRGIIYWITMTRKSSKHCGWHKEPLDSCFNLIRSYQQCISWSPLMEIEPVIQFMIYNLPVIQFINYNSSVQKTEKIYVYIFVDEVTITQMHILNALG